MRLVLLHGPPASGKYTVGRELAALIGGELYHNHLVVDEVLTRHAFGTPAFVAERDRTWRQFFAAAAPDHRRRVIFTFSPENTVPQAFVDWLFSDVVQLGATVHSVSLTLSEAEIESRLASTQRQQFRKLTDLSLYRKLRTSGAFRKPMIPRTDLEIDTARQSAREAALKIKSHFALL